jgi:hypothetical protein
MRVPPVPPVRPARAFNCGARPVQGLSRGRSSPVRPPLDHTNKTPGSDLPSRQGQGFQLRLVASKSCKKIAFSKWRHKLGHNPRFSVYDGRTPLGVIFETRGIFTAINPDGNLVAASTSVQAAANALTARGGSS